MKLKLYEIEKQYIDLAQSIIDNEGEVTPEQEQALQITQDQLETKGRGYGFIIKDLETDCDIIDIEIKRLQAFKSSRNKTIDKLKERLTDSMILFGIDKIESPTLKISFRNSESVEVEELIIDAKYCKTKTTITPDKAMIKEAIKRGEKVVGAILKQNNNLQIK